MAIGGGGGNPGSSATRRGWLGRGWKRLGRSERVRRMIGGAAARYIRLVGATNRLITEGPVDYAGLDLDRPIIITMWHGQHLLLPAIRRKGHEVVALISRHRDGDLQAFASEKLGIAAVRGSAAREQARVIERGGISGFLKLRNALKEGKSVSLTADLSRQVARRAGIGIIRLARASGAPIAPVALATSRRLNVRSWDRTSVNLPFGRMAMVTADLISVPADADDDAMEEARLKLEAALNRATERAYALVDKRHV